VGRVRAVDGDPLAPVGVRYLTGALRAFVASPPDAADRVIEKVAVRWESARRRGRLPANHAAQQWERDLHAMLGAAWPCPHAQAFAGTWEGVLETMTSGGLSVGRRNYGDQDDADPGFARALWCIVHHLHAQAAIETGVAHGVSSRVMLEALREGSGGQLYSIDLPPMLVPQRWSEMAVAVPLELRDRWTLLKGSSRRQLPDLLRRLGRIDLFVHDSRHSTRNVHWELSAAWPLLAPGGVVVVDDADVNWGFELFLRGGDASRCGAWPMMGSASSRSRVRAHTCPRTHPWRGTAPGSAAHRPDELSRSAVRTPRFPISRMRSAGER